MAGVARRSSSAPRPHGRHFLRSRRLVEALVADAGIGPRDLVLDLGAGAGALARELARRARRVWAIELDPALAADLRRRFGGTGVRVVQADATRLRWPGEPFKVVANVPFDRTTAILRALLDDPSIPLVAAELVVQWELAAKRAAVWPSTFAGSYWARGTASPSSADSRRARSRRRRRSMRACCGSSGARPRSSRCPSTRSIGGS